MVLPPESNHGVTLAEASVLTANFRKRSTQRIRGGMFWKEAVERVVNQQGCIGMRYYYGQNDDGTPVIVLVGVDANGRDMTGGFLAERSSPCPPYCDAPNALNRGEEITQQQSGPIRYKVRLPERETTEINAKL